MEVALHPGQMAIFLFASCYGNIFTLGKTRLPSGMADNANSFLLV